MKGASQINGGLLANFNLGEDGERQFMAGAYSRHKDAVIPMAGFVVGTVKFTFSYDATISTMRDFNRMRGASELSIIKSGFYSGQGDRAAMCPQF